MSPSTASLFFRAGEERGIARVLLSRAHSTPPSSEVRRRIVKLARDAGHESIRYLRAARGAA